MLVLKQILKAESPLDTILIGIKLAKQSYLTPAVAAGTATWEARPWDLNFKASSGP